MRLRDDSRRDPIARFDSTSTARRSRGIGAHSNSDARGWRLWRNIIMATSRKMYPWRDEGILTYGLEFPEAAEEQIKRLGKKRVFLVASGGLSRNTDEVKRLEKKLGDTIVGRKIGIQPHSLWSEILEIADAVRAAEYDNLLLKSDD